MTRMSEVFLRVMLVDDHEVVRAGIRALLQSTDDIIVTAEAGSVREAVDEADRSRPDLVVMDVRLADGSGIEATREILAEHPGTRVIMLTSFADDEALFSSIMAGASGYVLKQVAGGELVRAIRAVGAGESLLDPAVTKSVLDRLKHPEAPARRPPLNDGPAIYSLCPSCVHGVAWFSGSTHGCAGRQRWAGQDSNPRHEG